MNDQPRTDPLAHTILDILEACSAEPGPETDSHPGDIGPMVLAALAGESFGAGAAESGPASRAMQRSLRALGTDVPHGGVFGGGTSGYLLGLGMAARTWPACEALAHRMRDLLLADLATHRWGTSGVGWSDYDLVSGPAGISIALASDDRATETELSPLRDHLVQMLRSPDLGGLRVSKYRDDALRGWNYGHVNTGLAHGAAGVAVALCFMARRFGPSEDVDRALRSLAYWYLGQSFVDDRGIVTWDTADVSPRSVRQTSRRQAWCYGSPGIAWMLWEAGSVLGDEEICEAARRTAGSFVQAFDDEWHVDGMFLCHGAAGVMLLADCFDRYAAVPGADRLRDRLRSYLWSRLAELPRLARSNAGLLGGASGVAAALAALESGQRDWLPALGLR
ncbi:hypothetical protein RKD26_000881 [Streptomyces calvus]|uniref:lanthionine synthetase LanC family protein n=1 Tax=Streptomyces calvus TaxID=67282 RepID=UPI003516CEA3